MLMVESSMKKINDFKKLVKKFPMKDLGATKLLGLQIIRDKKNELWPSQEGSILRKC